jgi:hypothetical protein
LIKFFTENGIVLIQEQFQLRIIRDGKKSNEIVSKVGGIAAEL